MQSSPAYAASPIATCSKDLSVIKTFFRSAGYLVAYFLLAFITSIAAAQDSASDFNAGLSAFEQRNYLLAQKKFSAALNKTPDDVTTLRYLGLAEYKLQENKSALDTLEKALSLDDKNAQTQYAAGVVNLARAGEVSVLKVRKYLKASIEHFETAIALDPKHGLAQYYLIQVLLNAPSLLGGDDARAAELNAMLATTDPFLYEIGKARSAIKDENWAEAEKILLAAQQDQPNHSALSYSLAETYLQSKDYDQSIKYGQQFLATDKNWDETSEIAGFYVLARAYQGNNDKEKSRIYYQKAIDQTKNKKYEKGLREEMAELDK